MRTQKKGLLILDANTLIDYCNSDRMVIRLISDIVGKVHVAMPVFDEVKGIDEAACSELGIQLVEPSIEHVVEASKKIGPLSFQDKLCYILAKENGWTCVTNDKPLRKHCEINGVDIVWGIELICILTESGGLSSEEAKEIIILMQSNNPKYITTTTVNNAFKRLNL